MIILKRHNIKILHRLSFKMILSFRIYFYISANFNKIPTTNNTYEKEFEKFRTEYSFYRYS